MLVVFLDIDGVLNSRKTHKRFHELCDAKDTEAVKKEFKVSSRNRGDIISRELLSNLHSLVESIKVARSVKDEDVEVVIISSWYVSLGRRHMNESDKAFFSGILEMKVVDGLQNTSGDGLIRFAQSAGWLRSKDLGSRDIALYLDDTRVDGKVVDACAWMYEASRKAEGLPDFFVPEIRESEGLTEEVCYFIKKELCNER